MNCGAAHKDVWTEPWAVCRCNWGLNGGGCGGWSVSEIDPGVCFVMCRWEESICEGVCRALEGFCRDFRLLVLVACRGGPVACFGGLGWGSSGSDLKFLKVKPTKCARNSLRHTDRTTVRHTPEIKELQRVCARFALRKNDMRTFDPLPKRLISMRSATHAQFMRNSEYLRQDRPICICVRQLCGRQAYARCWLS